MGGYRDYDDEDRAGDLPEDPKRMWKSLNMIFKYLLCGFTALIGLAALLLVLALLTWFTGRALAGPLFEAEGEDERGSGLKVVLYEEPSAIKTISNLTRRATWVENGMVIEGCWSPTPVGVVMLYFHADRTVVVIPNSVFQRMPAL